MQNIGEMPTFKRHAKLFNDIRTFLRVLWMFYEDLFSVQFNSVLQCLFQPPAMLVQVWIPESQRQARRRAIRMLLFTSATNMKPMHRLTPARKSLARDSDPPVTAPSYIRALFRFRISWKVESYDRYVLEIGKSIHILFALTFFIYTGRTPLHKRAEIYGREEPHFIPFLLRRKWAPILFVGPSLFSKTIINYTPTEFLNLLRLESEIYFALWSNKNGLFLLFLFSVKLLHLLHVIPETLILNHSFRVQNPFFISKNNLKKKIIV